MGNSISFKAIGSNYMAAIQEKHLSATSYVSIFKLGDLDKLKKKYSRGNNFLEISIYDNIDMIRLYEPSYEQVKNRGIVFVIKSNYKDIIKEVVKTIIKLKQWNGKEISELPLPRIIEKCPYNIYNSINGWKNNGLRRLAYTEIDDDAKIVYLKKKRIMIISSNTKSANQRILQRIKNYKRNVKHNS